MRLAILFLIVVQSFYSVACSNPTVMSGDKPVRIAVFHAVPGQKEYVLKVLANKSVDETKVYAGLELLQSGTITMYGIIPDEDMDVALDEISKGGIESFTGLSGLPTVSKTDYASVAPLIYIEKDGKLQYFFETAQQSAERKRFLKLVKDVTNFVDYFVSGFKTGR